MKLNHCQVIVLLLIVISHSKLLKSQVPSSEYQYSYTDEIDGVTIEREEHKNANGRVIGHYSIRDSSGHFRIVQYIADENGYNVRVISNEPGVANFTSQGFDPTIFNSDKIESLTLSNSSIFNTSQELQIGSLTFNTSSNETIVETNTTMQGNNATVEMTNSTMEVINTTMQETNITTTTTEVTNITIEETTTTMEDINTTTEEINSTLIIVEPSDNSNNSDNFNDSVIFFNVSSSNTSNGAIITQFMINIFVSSSNVNRTEFVVTCKLDTNSTIIQVISCNDTIEHIVSLQLNRIESINHTLQLDNNSTSTKLL